MKLALNLFLTIVMAATFGFGAIGCSSDEEPAAEGEGSTEQATGGEETAPAADETAAPAGDTTANPCAGGEANPCGESTEGATP